MNETFASAREHGAECNVCSGQHDEAIHAATMNVHAWFRGEVRTYFECEQIEERGA
jgi:hypothetical protein